jgi:hypothetical protein
MATLNSWKRFLVGAPEAQREYRTIEIFHPQLDQVYRFVSNYIDVDFTIESTGPRNASESVTFRGVTMQITEPAERQDSEQNLSISFGNVDGTIHDIVDQITGQGFFDQIEIVYRKYYSGDLTQPAISPLYLFASNIAFSGPTEVSFTAEDVDLSQKRSGLVYTIEDFPGLKE